MNNLQPFDLILAPCTTEKTVNLVDTCKQFTFKVHPRANKPQVRKAIERIFKVKVTSVNMLKVIGKAKRFKQIKGNRGSWKKAIVTLGKDQDINLAEFE